MNEGARWRPPGVKPKHRIGHRRAVWAAGVGLAFLAVLALKLPPLAHLLDGPRFCGACHAMRPQVDSYLHSAHREAATCGDCHLPHGLVEGAFYKAYTGTRDVVTVALGNYREPITLSSHGTEVVHENCRRCHASVMALVGDTARDGGPRCFACHRSVPHLR